MSDSNKPGLQEEGAGSVGLNVSLRPEVGQREADLNRAALDEHLRRSLPLTQRILAVADVARGEAPTFGAQMARDAGRELNQIQQVASATVEVAKVIPAEAAWELTKTAAPTIGRTLVFGVYEGIGLQDLVHGNFLAAGSKFFGINDIKEGWHNAMHGGRPIWGVLQMGLGFAQLIPMGSLAVKGVKVCAVSLVRAEVAAVGRVIAKDAASKLSEELLEGVAKDVANGSLSAIKNVLGGLDDSALSALRANPTLQLELAQKSVSGVTGQLVGDTVRDAIAVSAENIITGLKQLKGDALKEFAEQIGSSSLRTRAMRWLIADPDVQTRVVKTLSAEIVPELTEHVYKGIASKFHSAVTSGIEDIASAFKFSDEALQEGAERGLKEGVEVGVKRGVREGIEHALKRMRWRKRFDFEGEGGLGKVASFAPESRADDGWTQKINIWLWSKAGYWDDPDLYKKRDEITDDHYAAAMQRLGDELTAEVERKTAHTQELARATELDVERQRRR